MPLLNRAHGLVLKLTVAKAEAQSMPITGMEFLYYVHASVVRTRPGKIDSKPEIGNPIVTRNLKRPDPYSTRILNPNNPFGRSSQDTH